MSEIILSSDIKVDLVRHMASDEAVIQAAQVSVKGANNPDTVPARLIQSLMKNRHGVPFEHTSFTFLVEVPIFVARQWVKHRMSSMNEVSGRYRQLQPKFYIPEHDRPMVNHGTKMTPKMGPASYIQAETVRNLGREVATSAWKAYQTQLKLGIAEEMARTVLPVSIYTQFYWTLNGRSLLNFLERRVDDPEARVPSHPQYEIELGAHQVEGHFKSLMPLSHDAFLKAQRVAP